MSDRAPSFREVQEALGGSNAVLKYNCVTEKYQKRCMTPLDSNRIEEARRLITKDVLVRRDIWDVVNLLLCDEHLTWNYKNKVENIWKLELHEVDFSGNRHHFPYASPSSEKSIALGTSQHGSPSPPPRPPLSTLARDSQVPLQRSGQPEAADQRDESNSAPAIRIYDTNKAAGRRFKPQHPSLEETEDFANGRPHTPSRDDFLEAQKTASPLAQRGGLDPPHQHVVAQPSSDGEFIPGDAYSWAPQAIVCGVKELLFEPLPKPNDLGCIYVVQDAKVPHPPHVKIGITVQSWGKRLKDLQREHNRELNMKTADAIGGIPYIQLVRLEKLVHADLAFFQRSLQVVVDGKKKTRQEWFAIDLPTAYDTMRLWWDVLQKYYQEDWAELDTREIRKALNRVGTIDRRLTEGQWLRENTNHGARLE
jgi:hypothetical protein